jgi:hypothetical protein
MKTYLFKVFSFTAILTFILNSFVSAQVTSTTADGRNNPKPQEVQNAEAAVARVITESGNASCKA